MKLTTVVNLHHESFDVYIGRAGRGYDGYFGNPFRIERTTSRKDAIQLFQEYFNNRIISDSEFRQRVLALKGERLGCFCKPHECHGDVIANWLNEGEGE